MVVRHHHISSPEALGDVVIGNLGIGTSGFERVG